MHLELVTIIVDEYDPAIRFFVDVLGFTLVTDEPSTTNDGRPKRWVVVRPPNAQTGLLLARADQAHKYTDTPIFLNAAVVRSRRWGSFETLSPWVALDDGVSPTARGRPI